MNIPQLIELAENRIRHLQAMIKSHEAQGDVEAVMKYQVLLDETQETLAKLKSI
jgi:hypothetical protein